MNLEEKMRKEQTKRVTIVKEKFWKITYANDIQYFGAKQGFKENIKAILKNVQ